jgi:serine/threonine protein kinase
MILTKSLDLEHGRHRHFAPEEPLPFDILGPLGSGGYGQVDKILSKISFRHYALKRVRRRDAFGKNSKEAVKVFLNELKIAKSLEHKHFVRYVGSYTDKHHLGLVIAPVAEADLGTYMRHMCASTHTVRFDNTRPLPSSHLPSTPMEMCVSLRTYFGCLAAALTYLHSQSIRHKDIKPQNILVSKGNVLFSDFGLSRNFADDPGSTTSGLTPASPRYCAPEVAAYESRNTSSDVWSLGCVFLEMAAALQSINADRIKQYYMSHGSLVSYYHANPAATSKLISHWETSWDSRDKSMLGWVKWMLMTNRFERPTAAQVLELILDVETDEAVSSRFCGICCVPIADTDSCDSLADEFSYMAASQRPQTSDDGHRTTSTSHLMDNETKVPSLDRGRQIPQEQETRSMVSSRRNRMIAPGTNSQCYSGWLLRPI